MTRYPFNPLVSIVIPVYNGSNFLDQAIKSALQQTYDNIEIIVIDDGSSDDGATERIVQSYDDRVLYYKKSNGGVASALNFAIKKMAGTYFSWLSHDDIYVPDKIERQINFLSGIPQELRDKTIVYGNYSVFNHSPQNDHVCFSPNVPAKQFRYSLLVDKNAIHGCTLLIPKMAFDEIGMFNEALRTTQDYDLWFRMGDRYTFICMRDCLVKSRSHAEQGSVTMAAVALTEGNNLFCGYLEKLRVNEITYFSKHPPANSYALIAASLWYRGFWFAGVKAARLCLSHFHRNPWYNNLNALASLLKGIALYSLFNPVRKRVPPMIRRIARNTLHLITNFAKPSKATHPDSVLGLSLKEKFSQVYENNIFKGRVSRSGEGSDLIQTQVIRHEIPRLIKELNVATLLDAPCGDWYWMQQVDLPVERYIGVDIVEALIQKNQTLFGNEKIKFITANLAEDPLPKTDLIFSRDCLVHLSYADALKILANFKRSSATYLLTTTFSNRTSNIDLGSGFWRPLNKQLAPFNFPSPLRLINEGCTEGNNEFTDKCLGLWYLSDIPV